MSLFAVVVLAAGKSTRFADPHYKKPYALLAGRAVWMHSVESFINRPDVCQTILVISPEDREEFARKFGANVAFMEIEVVEGGAERADSVTAALEKITESATHIAIHDAARPLVTDAEVDRVFAAAVETDAAILASPVTATLKRVDEGVITSTTPRENLWAAQTPQVFELALYRQSHAAAAGAAVTDDAQLLERFGKRVTVVETAAQNLKITHKADLSLAEAILAARPAPKGTGGHPFRGDDLWR